MSVTQVRRRDWGLRTDILSGGQRNRDGQTARAAEQIIELLSTHLALTARLQNPCETSDSSHRSISAMAAQYRPRSASESPDGKVATILLVLRRPCAFAYARAVSGVGNDVSWTVSVTIDWMHPTGRHVDVTSAGLGTARPLWANARMSEAGVGRCARLSDWASARAGVDAATANPPPVAVG